MVHLDKSAALKSLAPLPLLMTESQQEYDSFVSALVEEIKPANFFEELYIRDIVDHAWHIRRLGWARIVTINMGYRKAIVQLLVYELQTHSDELLADRLAEKWFTCEKARTEVANLLEKYNLDVSAIQAEAIKLNSSDLESLGKEQAFWEACRNKAIRNLDKQLAKRVRAVTQRAIDSDGRPNPGQPKAAE